MDETMVQRDAYGLLQEILEALGSRNNDSDLKRLNTEIETADFLEIKPQTLAVWRHKGTGPSYVKIGASVRYERDAVYDYIGLNRVGVAA